jgi:SAM-dependent methyltransferase
MKKWVIVGKCIAANVRTQIRYLAGDSRSGIGASHSAFAVEQSVAYINRVFSDYLQYGGLTAADLTGKRVLEVGPGDNLGVSMRFVCAGASQVIALDRFVTTHDPEKSDRIYRALRDCLDRPERGVYDAIISEHRHVRFSADRIQPVYNVGIERADEHFEPNSFDLIVSRAVLEEVYQIDRAFAAMDRLLRPGGALIHKIDLTDYGLFSGKGFHPLEFLTIPNVVYGSMSRYSAIPHRHRANYYRDKMHTLGYEAMLFITRIAGDPNELNPHKTAIQRGVDYGNEQLDRIRSIRPRLAPAFRDLADEDLLAAGLFLTARKPIDSASPDR